MRRQKRNRKPQDARSPMPMTRKTRGKREIRAAEKLCGNLLHAAGHQAAKGNCRLLAEILRFLRPSRPVIMLAGKNVLPIEN
jgi:hypothetical protein